MECKSGSVSAGFPPSAGFSRYMTWKSEDGRKEASKFTPQLETLLTGMLNQTTLLDLIRNLLSSLEQILDPRMNRLRGNDIE